MARKIKSKPLMDSTRSNWKSLGCLGIPLKTLQNMESKQVRILRNQQGTVGNVSRFIALVQQKRRISLHNISKELGFSERTIYRWIRQIGPHLPIRIEDGIIKLNSSEITEDTM